MICTWLFTLLKWHPFSLSFSILIFFCVNKWIPRFLLLMTISQYVVLVCLTFKFQSAAILTKELMCLSVCTERTVGQKDSWRGFSGRLSACWWIGCSHIIFFTLKKIALELFFPPNFSFFVLWIRWHTKQKDHIVPSYSREDSHLYNW